VRPYTVHPNGNGSRCSQRLVPGQRLGRFVFARWRRIVFDSDRNSDYHGCGDLIVMTPDGAHTWAIPLPFDAYEARWGTAPLSSAPSEDVAAQRVVPVSVRTVGNLHERTRAIGVRSRDPFSNFARLHELNT
jgi:hypothetical protein